MTAPILIIDSSAPLHRYDCAPGHRFMGQWKGQPMEATALHYYVGYTLALQREFNPLLMIHVLDPPGGSKWRLDLFPAYKANRAAGEPRFIFQKQIFGDVMAGLGCPWACVDGEESDDVMASLATRIASQGGDALIVSPDKDMLGMVSDHVQVARFANGGHWRYDAAAVQDKIGVLPLQVADWLALMGDSTDNIPGIPKCGKKTAAKLLQTYGDLDALLTHRSEIKGTLGERLREHAEDAKLSRQLTSLHRNIDVPIQRSTPTQASITAIVSAVAGPQHWIEAYMAMNLKGSEPAEELTAPSF